MSKIEKKLDWLESKIEEIMKNQELNKLLKEYELAQENHHHYDRLLPALNSFLVASTLAALWLSIQFDPIRTDLKYIGLLALFSISIAILWLSFTRRLGLFLRASLERCWAIEWKLFNLNDKEVNGFSSKLKEKKEPAWKLGKDIPLHNYIRTKDDAPRPWKRLSLRGASFNKCIFGVILLVWAIRILIFALTFPESSSTPL